MSATADLGEWMLVKVPLGNELLVEVRKPWVWSLLYFSMMKFGTAPPVASVAIISLISRLNSETRLGAW